MTQEKSFFVDERGDLRLKNIISTSVAVIIALIVICGSFRVISAEEVGIPVTLGKVGDSPRYGLSMKWPLITHFVKFDKTTQKMILNDSTYTTDIQPSNFVYVFTYRIVADNAPQLYLTAGRDYESKLVEPKLHAILKDVIGQYSATELIANRGQASAEVEARLREELSSEFFTDISISINNIVYTDEFEAGINAKVLAKEKAQEAKNRTVQIEEEGRQAVITAQAEADAKIAKAQATARAMDIEGAALRRNSQYLELKKLDVQAQMAESAKSWQTVIMSSGQANALLNIPNN
jgi:regulator of protease activity HflC (stomatin/prohibitin superfamily)